MAVMKLHKSALTVAVVVARSGWLVSVGLPQIHAQPARAAEHAQRFSDVSKAALSRQLTSSVGRGDTPGVVALIVGRVGVLFEYAAGKLDLAHNIPLPVNAFF
jgi:hypothetical protein